MNLGSVLTSRSLNLDGVIDTPRELNEVVRWLKSQAASRPGFKISTETVVGTFSDTKLPMVRDLEDAYEVLFRP